MTRRPAFCLLLLSLLLAYPATCGAVSPEVTAGLAAAQAAPQVLGVAKELGTVPLAVGQTLALPFGIAEMALCPLPGFTLANGAKNTARGLRGPAKLIGTCLKLPLSVLNTAAAAVR